VEGKQRVLIVEDEMITAINIKKLLEERDYSVCGIAMSGEEAIHMYSEKKPEIVLLDIILQDSKDGIEVALHIRKNSDIPIIFLTAQTDRETVERAKSAYPQGYISKPITTQDLFSALEMAKSQYYLTEALKRSEEKFRRIFMESPIGIILYNEKGYAIDANPAVCSILAVEGKESLLGLSLFSIPGLSEEQKNLFHVKQASHADFEYNFDTVREPGRYATGKRGKANLSVFFSPLLKENSQNENGGYLLQIQDTTEKKEMERAAEEQRQQLMQADKLASLGTLVTGVAHEINNPNQAILANSTFLKDAWESAFPILDEYYRENGDFLLAGIEYSSARQEIEEYQHLITDCAKRIDIIVKDLKELGRYDPDVKMKRVDINTVLHRSITLLGHFINTSTNNFTADYGENLPAVSGNPQKLGQVFINLIQNACQALPAKNKGIDIKSFYNRQGDRVIVEIKDEGTGIPENLLAKIRDPFFTTKRAKGTGLGLTVSSTIIENHLGNLEFYSEEMKGTRVRVSLPAMKTKGEF
jgi:two-component system, NtrC family, sensor kinase